jgi:hypothetical protein
VRNDGSSSVKRNKEQKDATESPKILKNRGSKFRSPDPQRARPESKKRPKTPQIADDGMMNIVSYDLQESNYTERNNKYQVYPRN